MYIAQVGSGAWVSLRLKLLLHSASQEAEDNICRWVRLFQMISLVWAIDAHRLRAACTIPCNYDVSVLGWPKGHPHHEEAVALLEKNNPNEVQGVVPLS